MKSSILWLLITTAPLGDLVEKVSNGFSVILDQVPQAIGRCIVEFEHDGTGSPLRIKRSEIYEVGFYTFWTYITPVSKIGEGSDAELAAARIVIRGNFYQAMDKIKSCNLVEKR